MLHAELQPFKKTNYIGRINRAYRPVARELRKAGCTNLEVDVRSTKDASLWRDLFTVRMNYDANQWLHARGHANGFDFVLTLPFRNGVTLPYGLAIVLDSKAPLRARLGAWVTRRGRWFAEPANPAAARRLRSLKLPGVGWVHASGGLKHTLNCGGQILPPDAANPTNRWIVYSAYQGFLIGVRPRVTKYLKASPRLQALLNAW